MDKKRVGKTKNYYETCWQEEGRKRYSSYDGTWGWSIYGIIANKVVTREPKLASLRKRLSLKRKTKLVINFSRIIVRK
jgi:hypothetical protein